MEEPWMNMRVIGRALLWLGLLVGVVGGIGLTVGFHFTGIAWFVAIGLAKLTLAASLGLMTGGAVLQRLAQRAEQRKALDAPQGAADA
jgi:predicted phage tail protein